MNHLQRCLVLIVVVVLVSAGALGCGGTTSPEDAETQALAKQFIEAVYVSHDAALAKTMIVPFEAYGYVSAAIIDETIAADMKGKCSVDPASVKPGRPGNEFKVKEVNANDSSKGITQRVAWAVASLYTCAGQGKAASRASVVTLEKVNDKWCIARVSFDTGMGESHAFGLN
jgi:hypothetical protein